MRRRWLATRGVTGLFSLFVVVAAARADTVVLKNGAKIEGKVIQKRPDFIEVDRGGPSVIYRTDDIRGIEWSDPSSEMKERFSLPPADTEWLIHQGREVNAAAPRVQKLPGKSRVKDSGSVAGEKHP